MRKLLIASLAILILAACARPIPKAPVIPNEIQDIATLDQHPSHYLDPATAQNPLLTPETVQRLTQTYHTKFFAPWHRNQPGFASKDVLWGFNHYATHPCFGENKLPHDPAWADNLRLFADMATYPNTLRRAVTIRNTSLRVLPTLRPHFYDFNLPGEGYPFDNLQNSAVWINTPLFITQISVDGSWVLAESPFALGFIPIEDIAFIDDQSQAALETPNLLAITSDNTPIRAQDKTFLARAHIGTLLPLLAETPDDYIVLIPTATPEHQTVPIKGLVAKGAATPQPLTPTPANIARMADAMSGQPYGWGGLYEDRDCSATTRDILTPFGIWLERNSRDQALNSHGRFIDLHDMDSAQKTATILSQGVPFLSLIHRPGHIMLYIGAPGGTPLIFHNVWGVRTLNNHKEGRFIIGRAVVTTLHPGLDLPNIDPAKGDFLKAVTGLTVFGQ